MPVIVCAMCDRNIRNNESATLIRTGQLRGKWRHKGVCPGARPAQHRSWSGVAMDVVEDVVESIADALD